MGERHGLISSVIEAEHFVFGNNCLGDQPINPTGQWDEWLPTPEIQNVNDVEPDACVTFATLNCVESLLRKEFSINPNYSDRYLAWSSGTQYRSGNDPQTVCETLRTSGCVPEAIWPIDGSVRDFASFYTHPPNNFRSLALNFIDEYDYGHEWVPAIPQNIIKALTYSPLSAAVYAWERGLGGLYISPKGFVKEHDIMISGYEEGKYWKIFDSYDPEEKRLVWDFDFGLIKRHTLHRQIVNETAWSNFLKNIHKYLGI